RKQIATRRSTERRKASADGCGGSDTTLDCRGGFRRKDFRQGP
ncbi:hypothetical protein NPIL_689091, partial [Nephila pilipes]